MRRSANSRLYLAAAGLAVAAVVCMFPLVEQVRAFPAGGHHSFLGGPWELVVKTGMAGEGVSFPISVTDENKPGNLDGVLPVIGTPIKVRLEHYLPDLKWETSAVEQSDGGIVARLAIVGPAMEQEVWLSSSDPARQSISSSIGGVAIKAVRDAGTAKELMTGLTDGSAVGIVSVWIEGSNEPLEYVAKPAETIVVPDSKYKLSVLEYMPHYSVDTETKKITNMSDYPINPAIRVSVDDGENTYEQWLWSKFASSPHVQTELALRLTFTDFDLGETEGKYIITSTSAAEAWLLFIQDGKIHAEKALLGRAYSFAGGEYDFSIEKIFESAIIKSDWKNDSENLLHPAIVLTVEQDGKSQRVVLELDKAYHHKTSQGTVILVYRRQKNSSK
jgi:hypothetical protein